MSKTEFTIRKAVREDAEFILTMIHELARYERLEDQITATVEDIRSSLFDRKEAEVIIGQVGDTPAAFALYYYSYSTFLGRANLFLEDLFVKEEFRGRGYGKAMLQHLAQIATENGCRRLDWLCLDWNSPAIAFYKGLGAEVLDDRRVFRISGERLTELAQSGLH